MNGRRVWAMALGSAAFAGVAGSAPAAEGEPPALFALIVGVNRSIDADLAPLAYADDDAVRYHDLFRSLGARTYLLTRPDDNTRRVSPQGVAEAREPRRRELAQALAALASDVARARARGVRTTFYFVYAGHGNSAEESAAYLTLEDARLHGVDIAREILDVVNADHMHLIVDACYSYLLAYGRGPGGRRREFHGFAGFGELARRPRVGLLLSTSSARESHEWDVFQAGVFSHEVRSGLYGAADVDRDGQVSYLEIAAFIARANVAIPNDRFRPEVFARPPLVSATIVDLRRALARRLTVDADLAQAHYLLEDSHGNRLAEFHKATGQAVSLLRPISAGLLFLRRLSDSHEFEIPNEPDVVRVRELIAVQPRAVPRGAAHHAFGLIFSRPFDETAVRDYQLPAQDALSEAVSAPAPEEPWSWRATGGVAALASAVAAGTGAILLARASRRKGAEAETAPNQERADALNQQVKTLNLETGLAVGFAALAGVGGVLLLLWPGQSEATPRPLVGAGKGGPVLGIAGSF